MKAAARHDKVRVLMRGRAAFAGWTIEHNEIATGAGQKESSRAAHRRIALKLVAGPECDDANRLLTLIPLLYYGLQAGPKAFQREDQATANLLSRGGVQFEVGRGQPQPRFRGGTPCPTA